MGISVRFDETAYVAVRNVRYARRFMLPNKLSKRESDFGVAFFCLSKGMHSWERKKPVVRASRFKRVEMVTGFWLAPLEIAHF
jgi:hypothetical protein